MNVEHPCKIAYYDEHGTNEPDLNKLHKNILEIESSIRTNLNKPRIHDHYEILVSFGNGFSVVKMTLNDITAEEVNQQMIINRGS